MRDRVRESGLATAAWLRSHDPGLAATRRAGRAAVVASALFALGMQVLHSSATAYYAAFGCFSMLLFVEFTGSMAQRLRMHLALAAAWAALVSLGTLTARPPWLAVASTVVVAFFILLSGVVSSVIAGCSTALLLAFVIPVTSPVPYAQLADRLVGVALAACGSMLAVRFLWPRAPIDLLSAPAARVCRTSAVRLRDEAALLAGGRGLPDAAARLLNAEQARSTAQALRHTFDQAPYRPTGLSTTSRAVVRLVDELTWLSTITVADPPAQGPSVIGRPEARAVCSAAADVLDSSAALLEDPQGALDPLRERTQRLRAAMDTLVESPARWLPQHAVSDRSGEEAEAYEVRAKLDLSFRAKELGFAATQIALNVQQAATAARRSWFEQLLGQERDALGGPLHSARARLGAHLRPSSVWFRNSLRGAVGLGIAVTLAAVTSLPHAFWILLGTLSVLRSNALNTGQNALRAVAGTVVGSFLGAVLLDLIGPHDTVLWFVLPVAIMAMGIAPTVISFTAGQAAFTITLVLVFSIGQDPDWHLALLRLQDVALGCVVSLLTALCLWPRGATAAVDRALAEAYTDGAAYLQRVVEFGLDRPAEPAVSGPSPAEDERRAAAAARRLDDSFRTYLAERGTKPVPLAAMTTLVTGVARLRLMADALHALWRRAGDARLSPGGGAARLEVVRTAENVTASYRALAADVGRGASGSSTAAPGTGGPAEGRRPPLVTMYRDLLTTGDTRDNAVRIVWTSKYLEAAQKLQASLTTAVDSAHRKPRRRLP
ncbi:FUSC family protein [Streptomyces sp. NPDC048278]|uniref:FUSC family protein n=1 Tax=Streptomyces sp. NPDC048278 TaxID=3155809 RepID=UPI00343599D7